MSCRPVTSGAPSHTTRSARPPLKWLMISRAVDSFLGEEEGDEGRREGVRERERGRERERREGRKER